MSVELCSYVCRDRGRLSQAEDEEWSLHPASGERTLIRIIKTGKGQCFLCAFFILPCSWKFTLNQQQPKGPPKTQQHSRSPTKPPKAQGHSCSTVKLLRQRFVSSPGGSLLTPITVMEEQSETGSIAGLPSTSLKVLVTTLMSWPTSSSKQWLDTEPNIQIVFCTPINCILYTN